jgi:hypothetical protein
MGGEEQQIERKKNISKISRKLLNDHDFIMDDEKYFTFSDDVIANRYFIQLIQLQNFSNKKLKESKNRLAGLSKSTLLQKISLNFGIRTNGAKFISLSIVTITHLYK